MSKRGIIAIGATLVVAATPLTALATTTQGQQSNEHKVTLCHANDSATGTSGNQPYVQITVDYHAATQDDGHNSHTGPVATSLTDAAAFKRADVHWGDIIPPVPSQHYAGLNWDAKGKAVYDNQCQAVTMATVSPLGASGTPVETTAASSPAAMPAVTELPKTGASDTLLTTLSMGTLTAAIVSARTKVRAMFR